LRSTENIKNKPIIFLLETFELKLYLIAYAAYSKSSNAEKESAERFIRNFKPATSSNDDLTLEKLFVFYE
jgi:hypothetical protein